MSRPFAFQQSFFSNLGIGRGTNDIDEVIQVSERNRLAFDQVHTGAGFIAAEHRDASHDFSAET